MPDTPQHLEPSLDAILRRLDQLEGRLAALEGYGGTARASATGSAPATSAPAPAARVAGYGQQLDAQSARSSGSATALRFLIALGIGVLVSILYAADVIPGLIWFLAVGGCVLYAFGGFGAAPGAYPEQQDAPAAASVAPATEVAPAPVPAPVAPKQSAGASELKVSVVLGRVGAGIVLLGLLTLFKLAVDSGIIGPAARVAIGLLVAVAALVAGERFSKRYAAWSRSFTGAGLALLYFTLTVASQWYGLVPREVSFVGMVLTTVLAGALALRHASPAIATFALLGGYLTPALLSTGEVRPIFLLCYLLVLDGGVLWMAARQSWKWLSVLAFIGSYLYLPTIADALPPLLAALAILLVFLLFNLLTVVGSVVRRARAAQVELILIVLNAALAFMLTYGHFHALWTSRHFGLLAIGLGLLFELQGAAAYRRAPEDLPLRTTYWLTSVGLLTIAVPMLAQDAHRAIPIAWSFGSLALLWVGFQLRERSLRVAAMVLLGLAILGVLATSTIEDYRTYVPVLNTRLLAFVVLIAVTYTAGWFYAVGRREQRDVPPSMAWVLPSVATLYTFALISLEITDAFHLRLIEPGIAAGATVALRAWQGATLAIVHTAFGATLLAIGLHVRARYLRVLGLCVLGFALLEVLSTSVLQDLRAFTPVLNPRALAYLVLIAAVYGASWLYARHRARQEDIPAAVAWVLPAAANALTLLLLTLEIGDGFDQRVLAATDAAHADALRQAHQVVLSVVYTCYAIALIAIGIARRVRWVRIAALALLGLTILKVLFVDTASLDAIARLALFISVGLLLLVASYSFQRFRRLILDDAPPGSDAAPG